MLNYKKIEPKIEQNADEYSDSKSSGMGRYRSITVTMTKAERDLIKKRAEEAKLTMSGYCRYILFGGKKR